MITVPAFNFALEYRNDVMITVSAKVWRIQVESCTMFMNEAPSSFEQKMVQVYIFLVMCIFLTGVYIFLVIFF